MKRDIRWYDFITINIFFLGLTALSQTMVPLILPLLVQQFVGELQKGTYLGTLRLWSLMVALLVQALSGMLSDRCTLRWGRRRPFVFVGTISALVLLVAVGFTSEMDGMAGYWVLFSVTTLLQGAANVAHGGVQGLIPDIVPQEMHGRFSGIKALLEVPLPVILVSFTIAPPISQGNMWGGIFVLMGILVVTMAITMLVPERPLPPPKTPLDWQPFLRLLLMTGIFTGIILGMGELISLTARFLIEQGIDDPPRQILAMGGVGLIAMVTAVVGGVSAGVRISLNREQRRRIPSFPWWVINRLAFLVGSFNLAGFAVYFLQARLGYTRETAAEPASQLMLFVGIFILLSALISGWLTDHFGRKRIAGLSGLLATLGISIMLAAPNLMWIYIGGSIVGIATGMFYSANWALGTSLVPKEEAGRYLGVSNLAGAGAGAVGAYIGGPIADFFTAQAPEWPGLGYLLIFVLYAILFLLSVAVLLKVEEPVVDEDEKDNSEAKTMGSGEF
jgi:MFS family permease